MIEILRVRAEDDAPLDDLCALLQDSVHAGASVGFLAPLQKETARRFWEGVVSALDNGIVLWVAREEGRTIGTVQLSLCAKENGRHRAEAQKLLVLTSHRRQGVATRLMEALEAFARANGRTLLYLDTQAGSEAELLYRRLAWRRVGEIPDYAAFPDGRIGATAIYYKILDAAPTPVG